MLHGMKTIKLIAASAALFFAGTSAASAAVHTKRAHTPSGNITCVARNYGGPGWSLTCSAADPGRTMRISTSGRAYAARYQRIASGGRELRYGGTYNLGPFRCQSFSDGLDCSVVPRGTSELRGFFISREMSYSF